MINGMLDSIKFHKIIVSLYTFLLNRLNRNVEAYIFVATTGRSGSASLTKIFSGVKEAVSLHEPYPIVFCDDFEKDSKNSGMLSLSDRKIINIKRAAIGKKIYIETNHLFIKTFYKYVISSLPANKIKIIHLVRDTEMVASSFYRIGSIPGKPRNGNDYLLDPAAKNNEIVLPELFDNDSEFSHDFYKCLWYWYEIEARTYKIKNSINNSISWYFLKTESINDKDKIIDLMKFLNIDITEDILSTVGTHSNKKLHRNIHELEFDVKEKHKHFKKLLISHGLDYEF